MAIAIRETYNEAGSALHNAVKEDLSDIIYDISPTDTPFVSAVGKGSCKSTYTEWQTDELAAADASNRVKEGDDAGDAAVTDTTRVGNYTQISDKVIKVSGTQEAVDTAGYSSALAYETMKKGLELRNDIEKMMVSDRSAQSAGNGITSGGASGAARVAGGVQSWIGSGANGNAKVGASATAITGDGTDANANDGTDYAFTEAVLEELVDACYVAGGSPNVLMVSPAKKRIINGFTGRANAVSNLPQMNTDSSATKISNSVDLYDSDYGSFAIVPNRHQNDDEVFLFQTDMWSIDYLRDFQTIDLATTGDSTKKQLVVEYTLCSKNQKASAAAYDLS